MLKTFRQVSERPELGKDLNRGGCRPMNNVAKRSLRRGRGELNEGLANRKGGASASRRGVDAATRGSQGSHQPDELRGLSPESVGVWR